jgi:chromosome segregation ATPase
VSRAPAVLLLMATTAGCASWPVTDGGPALLSRADHQAREGAWQDAVATYDEYLARFPDAAAAPRALESRDSLAAMLIARSELARLRAEVMQLRAEVIQLRAELAQARQNLTRREGDLARTRQELATRQAEADRLRVDLERIKQIDLRLERRRP